VGRALPPLIGSRRVCAAAAAVVLLAGPAAWSLTTAAAAHRGANIASGPGPAVLPTPPGSSPGSAPGDSVPTVVASAVRAGASGHRWAAAVVGHRAADVQLAAGAPVWELGGYSGRDPFPTPQRFGTAIERGEVHFLVVRPGDWSGSSEAAGAVRLAIGSHPGQRFGSWLLIDLTRPRSGLPAAADAVDVSQAADAATARAAGL
jgi:hypothetical protein